MQKKGGMNHERITTACRLCQRPGLGDIPAPVKSAAKASILDTLSVALGGVSYPMFQHIKEVYLKTEEGSHSACLFGDSLQNLSPHCRLPEPCAATFWN